MSQIISRPSAAECNLTIKKNHLLLSGAIYSYFFLIINYINNRLVFVGYELRQTCQPLIIIKSRRNE